MQCPQRIAGDRDFYGNGPAVAYEIHVDSGAGGRRLDLVQSFHARETKSNWSEAVHRLSDERRELFQVRDEEMCTQLVLNSSPASAFHYTDTNHQVDTLTSSPGDLHNRMRVRGDTGNADIDNCTSDDTKFGTRFREADVVADVHPDCAPPNGGSASIEPAEPDTQSNLEAAIAQIAQGLALRLDNVRVAPVSTATHTLEQSSELSLTLAGSTKRDFFAIPPWDDGGRYTFFVDDINTQNVRIEPDGGGYQVIMQMETGGVEIRSNCRDMLYNPVLGDFLDPAKLTQKPITELFSKGWQSAVCSLGHEYTVDLSAIEVRLRFFLDVDPSSGDIYLPALDPEFPEQDIEVDVTVGGMFGPCEGNVTAGQDDCMEPDEVEIELESFLQVQISRALVPLTGPAGTVWTTIGQTISTQVSVPPGAFGIIVGDVDGVNYGEAHFMVEN
jgi:hypothetical protein